MLLRADQPTPPFNSPYQQHTTRTPSLLESPYPSPVRNDSRSKLPQGLGLYEYQPITHGLPPSPQPSEAWGGHFSTGASPLMNEALADPWASGAFDHPVSRSPVPWASAHTSPRSSLSSYTRELSVFSHESSEQAYPCAKLEGPAWTADVHFNTDGRTDLTAHPSTRETVLTVAPERLDVSSFTYDNAYASSSMPKYEPASIFDYTSRKYERGPSEENLSSLGPRARSSYATTSANRERTRNRRHTDPAHAAFRCHLCPDKGFARRYNYTQHMLTHDSYRKKDNICGVPDCRKEFVRKTDLARHCQSVHQKSKPFCCPKCPSSFARKDTLRRHEEDGCPRRNQMQITDSHMFTQLRHEGYPTSAELR